MLNKDGVSLYEFDDCQKMDIKEVQDLYRSYVSKSQVDLIGSFGFGRVTASHSEGMYIYTTDGRKIYDFTGGIGVLNHGHNHPRILAVRQKFNEEKRMEVHKNFLSQYVAALSHNIGQLLPDDLNISYFCNSGAEAVEGALKMAYKYHDGQRKYVLHSDISFHGKLLGAAGLTGSPELHWNFPTIPNIEKFVYQDIESVRQQVNALRKANGESDVYAIIIEPMNGSSLRDCSPEFLQQLRDICTQEDIVLIFDEVYIGWAKTGALFNFIKKGVNPDIVTYAKSFGGGKSSISGYTTREPIFRKAYDNLQDATLHSTTYFGFGEECVTAMEAINVIIEEDYPAKARHIYERLNPGLVKLKNKYPDIIEDVRGSGALNGIVIKKDVNMMLRAALSFMPGDMFKDEKFMAKLITGAVISEMFNEHNVLTFFGTNREIPLIISPSLIASDDDIDHFLDALDKTLAVGRFNLIVKFASYKFLGK